MCCRDPMGIILFFFLAFICIAVKSKAASPTRASKKGGKSNKQHSKRLMLLEKSKSEKGIHCGRCGLVGHNKNNTSCPKFARGQSLMPSCQCVWDIAGLVHREIAHGSFCHSCRVCIL